MSQDIEQPQQGGSYIRNADGSLALVSRTAPPKTRPERAAEEAARQAAEQAEQPADEPVQTPARKR